MGWFGDKEFLVDLISYASIVSAAIFGLLALFTDYKKDGTITRWGRIAAGGIAVSAVFAMTSAVLQKQIASDEQAAGEAAAERQRDEQQAQFDQQMDRLHTLDRQMRQVNEDNRTLLGSMEESLLTQSVLLTNARRSMLMTAGLGAQERANTAQVLRTMWSDANRIDGASIELFVTYSCQVREGRELPRLLSEGADVLVAVTPAESIAPTRLPATAFEPEMRWFYGDRTELTAFLHDFSWRRNRGSVGPNMIHVMRYGRFIGEAMGPFREVENWRGAAIEILVTAPPPVSEAELAAIFQSEMGGKEELLDTYALSQEELESPHYRAAVLPCETQMALMVNGRILARPRTELVLVSRWPGFFGPRLVLKSHAMLVDPSALPRFAAMGVSNPPSESWPGNDRVHSVQAPAASHRPNPRLRNRQRAPRR